MTEQPEPSTYIVIDEMRQPLSGDDSMQQIQDLIRQSRKTDVDLRPRLPLKQYTTLREFEENA